MAVKSSAVRPCLVKLAGEYFYSSLLDDVGIEFSAGARASV
jgi:hypothetical protein